MNRMTLDEQLHNAAITAEVARDARSTRDEFRALDARIAELERERDGLKKFIAKQAASVRVLQRRLAAAGLNANMPGDAERQSITND